MIVRGTDQNSYRCKSFLLICHFNKHTLLEIQITLVFVYLGYIRLVIFPLQKSVV